MQNDAIYIMNTRTEVIIYYLSFTPGLPAVMQLYKIFRGPGDAGRL